MPPKWISFPPITMSPVGLEVSLLKNVPLMAATGCARLIRLAKSSAWWGNPRATKGVTRILGLFKLMVTTCTPTRLIVFCS